MKKVKKIRNKFSSFLFSIIASPSPQLIGDLQVTKVSLKDMYCPPVWGFVGLNKYVDVRNTLQNHVYKLPGKRFKSTLPQGSEQLEIRKIDCMVRDEDMKELFRTVANRKV